MGIITTVLDEGGPFRKCYAAVSNYNLRDVVGRLADRVLLFPLSLFPFLGCLSSMDEKPTITQYQQPPVDFSKYQMEDGRVVSTHDRIITSMYNRP